MQESIIVYRNPLEKALWEGTLFGDNAFPIMIAVVAFIAGACFGAWVFDNFIAYRWRNVSRFQGMFSLGMGALASFLAYNWLAL